MKRAPFLIPAAAIVVAVELALRSQRPDVLYGMVLWGLAVVARGRSRQVAAGLGAGLLAVCLRPDAALEHLSADLPVTVSAVRLSPWQPGRFGWTAQVRLLSVAQSGTVHLAWERTWMSVAGSAAPGSGTRLRAPARIRSATRFRNGVRGWRSTPTLRVASLRLLEARGSEARWIERVSRSTQGADSDGAALARALVLGDRTALSPSLVRGLRRAGLSHLLALSGLHIGLIAGVGSWLGRAAFSRAYPGSSWHWAAGVVASTPLLLLAGSRPAIVRASLMAFLVFVCLAGHRPPLRWNVLSAVIAVMVLHDPGLLRDLSFLLTVSATAGVFWSLEGAWTPRSMVLRASFGAQLFTLPWTLGVFHLATPAAAVQNLWAVPWLGLLLTISAVWVACLTLLPSLAGELQEVLDLLVGPFYALDAVAPGAWWAFPVHAHPGWTLGVAVGSAEALRRGRFGGAIALVVLLIAASCLWPRATANPELYLLDVGQGEAVVLRSGKKTLLIDGGGWPNSDFGGRVLVPALARLGIRRLDAVAMTHPDADHCSGLVDVLSYVPARELWTSPGWSTETCFGRLLKRPGLEWRPLWAGSRRRLGDWRLTVLHPLPGTRRGRNDRSLVLNVEARGFRALLTGDLEASGERALVRRLARSELGADLLKVGHHGSRTSTTMELLEAVEPRVAWISAGASNRFGHPHPEVLSRLEVRRVRVMRTDRDGRLGLRVGPRGQSFWIPVP